jgi:plasmid stabilization system protein ParE
MTIRLSKGAKLDFEEGLEWYRERSIQAAEGFIHITNQVAARIAADPKRYRPIDNTFRVIRYPTYPYTMVYRIISDELISITAIAHDKRKPGYWRGRKDT